VILSSQSTNRPVHIEAYPMMALSAYRHLLRAIRTAFQGDPTISRAARTESRLAFSASRSLEPHSAEALQKIQHANDVARVLRENVVQGHREGDLYRLKLHDMIERGDNDSVRNPDTGMVAPRVRRREGGAGSCAS